MKAHGNGHSKGTRGSQASPHRPRAGKRSTYKGSVDAAPTQPVNARGGAGTQASPRLTIGDDAGEGM